MKEYNFKNGFKVFVPEDLTTKQAIEEWASVAMYMAVMLHPVTAMKKERKGYTWKSKNKNKPKPKPKNTWRSPKKALFVSSPEQQEEGQQQ